MIRYFTAVLAMTATGATAQTLAEKPPAAPLIAPGSDANLFIFRDHAEPTLFSPTVKVDDRKVISIGEDRFTATRIAPGAHRISMAWPFLAKQPRVSGEFTLVEGQPIYFEVKGRSRYEVFAFRMETSLLQLPAEQGATRIRACCRFIPPK